MTEANPKWITGGVDEQDEFNAYDRNQYVQIDIHGINSNTMLIPKDLIMDIAKILSIPKGVVS